MNLEQFKKNINYNENLFTHAVQDYDNMWIFKFNYIFPTFLLCIAYLLYKHNNRSHMQKQEWEYVWHFKLQTSRSSHSGVKAAWALHFI